MSVSKCEPRGAARSHVEECVKVDRCLICGQAAKRRGLCQLHFSQWYSLAKQMATEERGLFEAAAIRAGKLLPSRQGRRGAVNPFDELAASVRQGG